MLRVYLFGGLMASWDETPLPPIAGTLARSLFAYLLTYRDRPHTHDLLAGTLWPDSPNDVARRRLSQALRRIRMTLDPHQVLLTERDTVQINPGLPLWLDVEQFTRHKAQYTGEGTTEESQDTAHDEQQILIAAYRLVMDRAGQLDDEYAHRMFLENVPEHREIVSACGGADQVAVRLPRDDAPKGRPLRDDEYLTITWTVAAPVDEALAEGPARRQAQLRRLLPEAAGQGAPPLGGNLAAALEVSGPRLRRAGWPRRMI